MQPTDHEALFDLPEYAETDAGPERDEEPPGDDGNDPTWYPQSIVDALPQREQDSALEAVLEWLLHLDPSGERFGGVLRESLDQVLDGPRTMRFRYSDLRKTEKTHVGTIVEINLGKSFDLADGDKMDYCIAGHDVDCKYSMFLGGWELPLESLGHLVLLTWANDDTSRWSAGLWRVDPRYLGKGAGNRDKKRKMLKSGQQQITWLWKYAPLGENLLLHLPDAIVTKVLGHKSGQQRMNELFRLVQRRIIRRDVILTVGQQLDSPRRARAARTFKNLGSEGIIVLGHYEWDVAVARQLGLPVPRNGEWVSASVAPATEMGPDTFFADGYWWRLAAADEWVASAPTIPRSRALGDGA